jgi:hypothetical protein
MEKINLKSNLQAKVNPLFSTLIDGEAPVLTVADRYVPREIYAPVFGVPKHWPGKRWVHLVHNWRTGGSSLTAILSVNVHDSYLKVGHPFTRDGWPVDYSLHPLQITRADQLCQWIQAQPSPGILAGHTYAGMAQQLGLADSDLWVTLREPAARLNSGLLRFHRKALNSDHPDGGYVGKTKGHTFKTAAEIEAVARQKLGHELNGMCRRIAGYAMLSPRAAVKPGDDLETCQELDERPVDQTCFDLAMDHLKSSQWIYLTEQVIPSLLLLEHTYNLRPLIHPCSNLVHNPQWNGAGITRLQESLLAKHRGLLESLNPWDVKLYKEAQQLFWKRWKEADIDPSRVEARRILQNKPLLNPNNLKNPSQARTQIQSKIEFRVRAARTPSVAQCIEQDGKRAWFWKR